MALFSKEPVDRLNPTAEEALNGLRDATMLLVATQGWVEADETIDSITRAGLDASIKALEVYTAWAGLALTHIVEQASV